MRKIRASGAGWLVCGAVLLCVPFKGLSQNIAEDTRPTRKDAIIRAEEDKQKALTPLRPPRGEQIFDQIETRVVDPIFNPNGLGIKLGAFQPEEDSQWDRVTFVMTSCTST